MEVARALKDIATEVSVRTMKVLIDEEVQQLVSNATILTYREMQNAEVEKATTIYFLYENSLFNNSAFTPKTVKSLL